MLNNLTECEEGDGGPNSQGEWACNSKWECVCGGAVKKRSEDEQMLFFSLIPVSYDDDSGVCVF